MMYLRKKQLAFMSIVNKVKGFVRKISGVSTLTLPDCVDNNSLISYTISGNSVQDGIPTPDTPVVVESVGEKTKNLFEIRSPDKTGQSAYNGYDGTDYTVYDYGYKLMPYTGIGFWFNDLEVGENYTISCRFMNSVTSGVYFFIGQNQGTASTSSTKNRAYSYNIKENARLSMTFTAAEENLISFGFSSPGNITITDIQLEKGDEGTDYEPYGKYKIPVVCSGRNLFSGYNVAIKGYESHTMIDNGVIMKPASYSQYTSYISFKLENVVLGGTYTISVDLDFDSTSKAKPMIRFGYVGTTGGFNYQKNKSLSSSGRYNITFTVPEEPPEDMRLDYGFIFLVNFTCVAATKAVDLTISNVQFEEGEVETDYEPYVEPITTDIYLDEPLRRLRYTSTAYYSDYIDFENGVVRRRIYEKLFSGSETWNVWTTSITDSTMSVYYRQESELGSYAQKKVLSGYGLSNYFRNTSSAMNTQKDSLVGYVAINGDSNPPYVAFKVPFVTKEEWAEWVKNKYELGEPLKVYWIWREASMAEAPITLPKLPTFKGTTIYSIDTSIQPSDMSATYYSTSKE